MNFIWTFKKCQERKEEKFLLVFFVVSRGLCQYKIKSSSSNVNIFYVCFQEGGGCPKERTFCTPVTMLKIVNNPLAATNASNFSGFENIANINLVTTKISQC